MTAPGAGATASDRGFMRRALRLAERGRGRVAPNPLVGAVAVRDGSVVGEGWHAAHGEEHAEVRALREAGERARDATLYVTLEPCRHEGKTPPCTRAIVDAGVSRVVVGCRDPHPSAAGGLEELRDAGVAVEAGVEGRTAASQNAAFLWGVDRDRPFVTLKLALSLDARIAAGEGERTAVTGEEALRHGHRLRADHDAVLVGRRTVEVDDPRLTVRRGPAPRRPPIRVVLDTRLRTSPDAGVVRTADRVPTWIVSAAAPDEERAVRLREAGVRLLEAEPDLEGEGLAAASVLETLAGEGVRSVLVEGGGRVAASFLRAERVERAELLYAPVLFGPSGVGAFPGLDALPGEWVPGAARTLGRDVLVRLESRRLAALLDEAAGGRSSGGSSGGI